MSRAAFGEVVTRTGNFRKRRGQFSRSDLVLGEVEAGLKKSKKEGHYTIGNLGTFTITKRPAFKGCNPQTGEAIRYQGLQGSEVPAGCYAEQFCEQQRSLADVSRFRH